MYLPYGCAQIVDTDVNGDDQANEDGHNPGNFGVAASLEENRAQHEDAGNDASRSAVDALQRTGRVFAEYDGNDAGDDLKNAIVNGVWGVIAWEENHHMIVTVGLLFDFLSSRWRGWKNMTLKNEEEQNIWII